MYTKEAVHILVSIFEELKEINELAEESFLPELREEHIRSAVSREDANDLNTFQNVVGGFEMSASNSLAASHAWLGKPSTYGGFIAFYRACSIMVYGYSHTREENIERILTMGYKESRNVTDENIIRALLVLGLGK